MPVHRDSELAQMAKDFYGYGRWDAPFWFIGREAAMDNDGNDNLAPGTTHGNSVGAEEVE